MVAIKGLQLLDCVSLATDAVNSRYSVPLFANGSIGHTKLPNRCCVSRALWVLAGAAPPILQRRLRRRAFSKRQIRRPLIVTTAGSTKSSASSEPKHRHQEVMKDVIVEAVNGHRHACTLIYLHGYTRRGDEYLPNGPLGFCMPWVAGGDRAPGLRAVLPTAELLKQPWGQCETSWYGYMAPDRNHVGDRSTVFATRRRLTRILRAEIDRLGGNSRCVFLGGASQGCTAALDVYVQEATHLRLGGFVGSIGFMPSDSKGFPGATRALEALVANREQAQRPVWLQCAVDDRRDVPWKSVVEPSLRRVDGRLHGLSVRMVSGRGHSIEDWEGHIVNDFLRAYASDAYS